MSEHKTTVAVSGGITGMVWFIGWLFTVAFANLAFTQALLALVVWPYFLGSALAPG